MAALLLACLAYLSVALPDSTLGLLWPSMRLSFGMPVGALGILLLSGITASAISSAATAWSSTGCRPPANWSRSADRPVQDRRRAAAGISPDLADVPAATEGRVRARSGAVSLAAAHGPPRAAVDAADLAARPRTRLARRAGRLRRADHHGRPRPHLRPWQAASSAQAVCDAVGRPRPTLPGTANCLQVLAPRFGSPAPAHRRLTGLHASGVCTQADRCSVANGVRTGHRRKCPSA